MGNIKATSFEGLLLFEPTYYSDSRGGFYESWRAEEYQAAGITQAFVQDNVSMSHKNVLRGLHFQQNQGQLVTVTHGRIYDVVVDIRPESKTFKQYFAIELSAEQPLQLFMPSGFAHGFCVLSDMAIVNYKCTQYYNPDNEGGIIWNDPDIGIEWPGNHFIIGSRDLSFQKLLA